MAFKLKKFAFHWGSKMRPRVAISKLLLHIGRFFQALPVAIMKPNDFLAYSRQTYSHPKIVQMYSEPMCVDSGLTKAETDLAFMLPQPPGILLLIGSGGGRDAIGLAKLGYEVTALDFSPDQLSAAEKNAARHGVTLRTMKQDMANLSLPAHAFDVVWLSSYLYSTIPIRKHRQLLTSRIVEALKTGGCFVCQFRYEPSQKKRKIDIWLKIAAWLSFGNFWYSEGDTILGDREFIHPFRSEEEILAEVIPSGFAAMQKQIQISLNCGAILFQKV